MKTNAITPISEFQNSPLEELLNLLPFWSRDHWPLLQACMYWNGFPSSWGFDDLVNPSNHPSFATNKKNIFKRVIRTHQMYKSSHARAKKHLLHHLEKNGQIYVTPYEFSRLCAAQEWCPTWGVIRELARSNLKFAIFELFKKRRPTPSLATQLAEQKPTSVHQQNRRKCQQVAARIVGFHFKRHKKKLTPTEVFKHKTYQRHIKNLAHPITQEPMKYSRNRHIKAWIPQAINDKRKRGRPKNLAKST